MTKKTVKRSLLASIIALVVSVSMLAGTTFAWFTDSVTSKNNVIKAGNLDVELEYAKVSNGTMSGWETVQGKDDIFDPNALWEPGRVEVVYLKVSNLGSLDLKYQLGVNFTNEVTGVNMAGKEFKLSDHLVFKAVELPDNFTPYTDREATVVASGTAQGIKDYSGATTPLAVDGVDYVALIVYMPETVGNEANYRGTNIPKIELGITLYATQVESEEDSFGTDYDKDAWVDGMKVNSANDLQSALTNAEAGDVVVLNNDITLTDAPIVIPAGENVSLTSSTAKAEVKPVVVNLNGKTIKIDIANQPAIYNYGNAIIGNGTVENGTSNAIKNDGTLLIKDGTFKAGSYAINNNGGNLTIENIVADAAGGVYTKGGNVVIENGTFYSNTRGKHVVYAYNANVTIKNGVFHSKHGANQVILGNEANITLENGSFITDKNLVDNWTTTVVSSTSNSVITINGGTFNSGILCNGGDIIVNDGSFEDVRGSGCLLYSGSVVVTGGSFVGSNYVNYVKKYVAESFEIKEENGEAIVYFPQESADSVIENAVAGETVELPKGTYTFPSSKLESGVTLNCAEGTVFEGTSSLNIKESTVIGATFKNDNGYAVSGTVSGTFKNCVFDSSETLRWCYVNEGETIVFENCVFKTDFRGIHFDEMHGTAIFKNCEINGFNAFSGNGTMYFDGCTFGNDKSSYNGLNIYTNTEIKNCTFKFKTGKTNFIDMEGLNKTLTIDNTVAFVDGVATNVTEYVGGSKIGVSKVTIDGVVNAFDGEGLIKALETESEVKLAKDITMNATLTNGYGVTGVKVKAGQVLDGNGFTLTVNKANSTWDSAINISGGTVKNITVAGAMRGIFTGGTTADIYLDNVTFKNVIYTFNSDAGSKEFGVYVTNSTINGWTSFSNCHKEVVFTNCSFGEGSGYAFCRPYNKVLFKGCTFAEGYVIDKSQTSEITFEDCVGLN